MYQEAYELVKQCSSTHKDYWRCCMAEHPETPDQHYYVENS